MLQEETIRRNERERKVMADKINSLERSLAAADTEKRQQEVSWHVYLCQYLSKHSSLLWYHPLISDLLAVTYNRYGFYKIKCIIPVFYEEKYRKSIVTVTDINSYKETVDWM